MNTTASETEMALQMMTHSEEKKAWNWEKYVAYMSSTILSWETLWNMGSKGLIQGQKSDTY